MLRMMGGGCWGMLRIYLHGEAEPDGAGETPALRLGANPSTGFVSGLTDGAGTRHPKLCGISPQRKPRFFGKAGFPPNLLP
jgi:hypothetical protein